MADRKSAGKSALPVISALSGDTVAEVERLEDHTVRLLKEQLEQLLEVTRFCQRISCYGHPELEEHEIFPLDAGPAVLTRLVFAPPNEEQRQALCAACRLNQPDVLEGMLRYPLDPNLQGVVNRRALHFAAGNGHVKCIALLLEAKADKDAACSDDGATALHLAAGEGHAQALQQLLEAAADLQKAMRCGRTALHCAAQQGHVEALQVLLDAGAEKDCLTRAPESASPLAFAAAHGQIQVMRLLMEAFADVHAAGPGPPALHMAATGGFAEAARMLLAAGARKDFPFSGVRPLHVAARFGHVEVAELLLEAAADADAVTTFGKRPLDLAVQHHQDAVVRLLHTARRAARDP